MRRQKIWETYDVCLRDWAIHNEVWLPTIPADRQPAWHMFTLLMPSPAARTDFIAHLKARNISAVFHYLPLHLSEAGRRYGGQPGDCPVTEDISERLVRLPFFNALDDSLQDRVIAAVLDFSIH